MVGVLLILVEVLFDAAGSEHIVALQPMLLLSPFLLPLLLHNPSLMLMMVVLLLLLEYELPALLALHLVVVDRVHQGRLHVDVLFLVRRYLPLQI
jgi:hypothetical protein